WHYSVGSEFSVDFSNLTRQSLIRSLIILPSIAIGVKRFNTIFLPQIKNFSIIFSFLEYWKKCLFRCIWTPFEQVGCILQKVQSAYR
ncbi:MAG: hypothetical protein IJB95_00130, partial [Clostridia bacterium]|nr:hypothetical protein [Clostridia bacterium]